MKKILLSLLCLLSLSTTAFATPSLSGTTGLITVPTAEALRYKEYSLAYDYVLDENYANEDDWRYSVNIGTFHNIELGIIGGKTPTEGVYINAKYYLTGTEGRFPLSLALGVRNLTSDHLSDVYMVGSKKIRQDLSVHFGFQALFTTDNIKPAGLGGVDYMINDSLKLKADIDYSGDVYFFNTGAELFLTQYVTLRGNIVDMTEAKPTGRAFTLGMSFSKFL